MEKEAGFNGKLVGGFRYFLFSPLREMIKFDEHILQMGLGSKYEVLDFGADVLKSPLSSEDVYEPKKKEDKKKENHL